jgi:hypothetical protein
LEEAVYILCAATALACSLLLLRQYRRVRIPLLLWCGLFFFALVCENAILFIDRVIVPDFDLSMGCNSVALLGLILLLCGLIWESK